MFAEAESKQADPQLKKYDGKTIGTYVEKKFRAYVMGRYDADEGNAAKGIDFPGIDVDIKTTSVVQPQSSCPFTAASQKVFGLGYSLWFLSTTRPKIRRAKSQD